MHNDKYITYRPTQFIGDLWFVRYDGAGDQTFEKYVVDPSLEVMGHPVKTDTKVEVDLTI